MDYGMLRWMGSNHLQAREKKNHQGMCQLMFNTGRETENYGYTCISKKICSMEELVPRIKIL